MAKAEAEAKFGDALRASKRELSKAGRELAWQLGGMSGTS